MPAPKKITKERSSGMLPTYLQRQPQDMSHDEWEKRKVEFLGPPSSFNPLNYQPPTPEEIKAARGRAIVKGHGRAGYSQSEASRVVGLILRTWQKYESRKNSSNYRGIPFAEWALFNILALGVNPSKFNAGTPDQIPNYRLRGFHPVQFRSVSARGKRKRSR
jgi:hypothetical protein